MATSMRDIARDMGMEAASLYNHINSKQELLEDLLMGMAGAFTKGMQDIMVRDISPRHKLAALIDLHVQLTIEETDAVSLIPNEWIHLKEPQQKNFLKLRNKYEKAFKSIISAGIDEGEIKPMNVDVALFSILSTLRWLYSWYSKNKMDPSALHDELKNNLLHGLIA